MPSVIAEATGHPPIVIELEAGRYALMTGILALLHLVCAFYLIFMGRIYWFLEDPYMEFFADLLAPRSTRNLVFWGGAFMATGALHCLEVLVFLFKTLRARFTTHKPSIRPVQPLTSRNPPLFIKNAHGSRGGVVVLSAVIARTWNSVFGRRGVFGIEGRYFYFLYLTREVIEIVSQCFQAYRFSSLIARPWINELFVALVVANCWSTPVLQYWFRKEIGRERLACIVGGSILTAATCMVVPSILFVRTFSQFERKLYAFPVEMLYDDVKLSRTWVENVK